MKVSIVTTILATSGLTTATATHHSKRTIGGTNATMDQFPYQVSVQRRVQTFDCHFGVHTCGGIIIARNKILTAAHCTLSDDDDEEFAGSGSGSGSQFQVRAGSRDWAHGGQLVSVNNITVHPSYKPGGNQVDDIAVLTLKSNLTLGVKVAIADLAGAEDPMPAAGTEVVVAGWGQTRGGKGPPSRWLRSLRTKVALRWICQFRYLRHGGIGSRTFCAGNWNEFEHTWAGDSGGALFDVQTKKVVGIVSYGPESPKSGYPTVFTSIAGYREFLPQVANV
ncbi:peptidase S1 domain protein [Metarhizium robertsii]|uniref:Peptidase S1/S6, chymotrypsin/Hap n=2 Tax=Metarhizium robertsii TaxID=568076 RepID=E9ENU4_METRA|nr:Peptidase S1/S6, chymotrypsin/Hap [Metarhizium robertsii ARSEF 23]EFZ02214.1 Peptidase S1/S6, chymotrypsin/Hap [Metarhizium robertsii ARSEF 23]EXV05387.1 peptidase S1 domain protein [Metarhizium robertsii]